MGFGLISCAKKTTVSPKSNADTLISFVIDSGQVGQTQISKTADSAKILIYVEQGVNLSAVKPDIKIPSTAKVVPASGQSIDFTKGSQVYTITAQSGISQKWYVQVMVYPEPDLTKYQSNPHLDSLFNQYFTRYSGWNSGDGAQSILLPDGRSVWLFGDSFVGPVNPNRTRANGNFLINNAAMIQNDNVFTSYYGGTAAAPKALFVPADPTHFYWTRHGFVDNNKLYVTLMELANITTNGTTSTVHEADKVAVLSLPDMKFIRLIDIPYKNAISYGDRSFIDGNYHYIFGMWSDGWSTKLYMARAKINHAEDPWEFYSNNDQWVADMSQAIPITIPGHVTEPTVINRNGRYYLFTQQNFYSKNILMYRADKPEGPYSEEKLIYTTPDSVQTYLALAHPQFIENNTLLIGYSLGGDIFASFKNVDIERPHFIRVNLPE